MVGRRIVVKSKYIFRILVAYTLKRCQFPFQCHFIPYRCRHLIINNIAFINGNKST